jgi:hypothetical protein
MELVGIEPRDYWSSGCQSGPAESPGMFCRQSIEHVQVFEIVYVCGNHGTEYVDFDICQYFLVVWSFWSFWSCVLKI